MTFPGREAVWQWLVTAPSAVVLSICLTATSALAAWTWAIAAEVKDHQTAVAVATEQARAANIAQQAVDVRLVRLEVKLDRLLEAVADMRAASTQSTRPRRVDKDREKTQ